LILKSPNVFQRNMQILWCLSIMYMKTPTILKNLTLFIPIHLRLKIESCLINLNWEWFLRVPKKKTICFSWFFKCRISLSKMTQKEQLHIWTLWFHHVHEILGCNFLRLKSKKVTSRFYNYFLTFDTSISTII
jgi:hypothetical protein